MADVNDIVSPSDEMYLELVLSAGVSVRVRASVRVVRVRVSVSVIGLELG